MKSKEWGKKNGERRTHLFAAGVEVLPNMAWLGDAPYLWPILCGHAVQVSASPSFFHAVKVQQGRHMSKFDVRASFTTPA
jgi:hypothetical protein